MNRILVDFSRRTGSIKPLHGINNGPVSLPLPTVRREPVPAAGPGMTPVGVPEPVGQAPAADSSTGPAVAAPRDL